MSASQWHQQCCQVTYRVNNIKQVHGNNLSILILLSIILMASIYQVLIVQLSYVFLLYSNSDIIITDNKELINKVNNIVCILEIIGSILCFWFRLCTFSVVCLTALAPRTSTLYQPRVIDIMMITR